eukprot:2027433-Amphidinium_carterae.1
MPGWLPDLAQVFGEVDHNSFEQGVVLYLGGGDSANQCCLLMSSIGPADEVFASAPELEADEAQTALACIEGGAPSESRTDG